MAQAPRTPILARGLRTVTLFDDAMSQCAFAPLSLPRSAPDGYKLRAFDDRRPPMQPKVQALILAAITLVAARFAAAADKQCAPPAWAPSPLPGYAIARCEERPWEQVDVRNGRDTLRVGGHRTSVTYELKDKSRNATANAARDYYAEQGKKAGAAQAASDQWKVFLRKAGGAGDSWYIYEHGGGNGESTTSYTVTTLDVLPLPQEVETRAMPGPLEVGKGECKDPPWVVKQFAAYKPSRCDSKAYDQDKFSLTNGPQQAVAGKRTVVNYALKDEKGVIVPDEAHLDYIAALKKSGAQVLRGEKEGHGDVIATQHTRDGDFWYVWEQAGGNDGYLAGYRLTTWQVAQFDQEVVARTFDGALDTAGCKDPEWLEKQFDYFKRGHCNNRDYDTVEVETKDGRKKLTGHVHQVVYELADPRRNPTPATVRRNYVDALTKIGAQLESRPNDLSEAVLEQKTPHGELWYIYRHGSGNEVSTTSYSLLTVQEGGPPPKSCKLEIYGVNFDFDKATLKPDSDPVLNQVLAIFKGDPGYSGEIGGHTDNVGKKDYNMKLSGERAAAVKSWLVAHGVDAARLRTAGYGDTKPLVPNTSDENRAKNRRVELKRDHCTGTGA
jgi:outer membrane protein OmpA-like peptidoglycan-associated protein